MNPAALVRGLAASLPENVGLLENSPIRRLERDGRGGFTLVSDQGCLRTRSLLLCTNIFTREFGYLTPNRLLPVMTFASWTRPLSDAEFQAYGGSADWGLTPADHAGTTVRMTLDRRLLVRNTYHHAADYAASERKRAYVRSEHRAAFDIRYPQLADVPFTHTWGGVYAMARNFTNFFGAVAPGVYVAACDNGVGAAWGTVSGALLADLAVGAPSPALDDIRSVTGLPALNPPEPLLGWAVRLRILLARWASQGEL
jgi:glycine/D-amino acid oxidase-like deaminating enzyme